MGYTEYVTLDRTVSSETFRKEFELIFRMPKGFDPKDQYRVKVFGERLNEVIESVEQRNSMIKEIEHWDRKGKLRTISLSGPKYCDVTTARKLAERLHISEANISRYIHGVNKSIPMHFFFDLYDIFGATPHYMAGYTDEIDTILRLDSDGEIVYKDGLPVKLVCPMVPIFSSQQYVHEHFSELLFSSPQHFSTITDLLYADKSLQEEAFSVLRQYLDLRKKDSQK